MAIATTSQSPPTVAAPTTGAAGLISKLLGTSATTPNTGGAAAGTGTTGNPAGLNNPVNNILAGKTPIPNPNNNPTLALTNSLLGGTGGTLAQGEAGIAAIQAQIPETAAQVGLENTAASQSAALQQQQSGLTLQQQQVQGVGLGQQQANTVAQQQAEQANYALQYGNNPNSAESLSRQGLALTGKSLQEQLANLTAQYGYQVPGLISSAAASGAGNSGAAQAALGSAAESYQFGKEQLGTEQQQNVLAGKQLTNTSEQAAVGQKAEEAGFQYSEQQLADQAKGLKLAEQSTGLSSQQITTTLDNAIKQANLGGTITTSQLLADLASGKAGQINQVLQAVGDTALASNLTASTPKGKK